MLHFAILKILEILPLIIKFHCFVWSILMIKVWLRILTLKTKYCTRTPKASVPLLACSSSTICFCFSSDCWSTSCWSICCCILLAFELFLLTILLLLLFSSSLTLDLGDTLSDSRITDPLRAELFGGGVAGFDEWLERIDERGLPLAFTVGACPTSRLWSVKKN